MIEVKVVYDNKNISKKCECPHYNSILIKGHAYKGCDVKNPSNEDPLLASKICASVTSITLGLKNIVDMYEETECYIMTGYFYYVNNTMFTQCRNRGGKYFIPSLDYRLDTLIWTLDYLQKKYPEYIKIEYEEYK